MSRRPRKKPKPTKLLTNEEREATRAIMLAHLAVKYFRWLSWRRLKPKPVMRRYSEVNVFVNGVLMAEDNADDFEITREG